MLRRVPFFAVSSRLASQVRLNSGVKSHDPNYEDDRWFEAELAKKHLTPEERYAAQKEHELMKKMMTQVKKETVKIIEEDKVVEAAKDAVVKDDVEALKLKLKILEQTVDKLLQQKNA